ncbi:zinc finger and SCAN domain-containing protein 2-like [Seriola dumerili]|uniref:Zinc finger and SCAN domain-containing protein 2-like n=1 Tax=Seriola dumerili TaxID=41447 RepID=A0A3B4VJ66_SERDU|nr:zinc finger and SCAN domain-containing protein 2-like [Seriola dumerili]
MFKTEQLKALVNERLKAAAEEIFSLFEQTIKDYEDEVFRSKQQIDKQRRRAGWKAPVQLSVREEDIPSEQEPCEKKTGPGEEEQEPLHIKEEQEDELWAAQAGEKQEEADTKETMFNIIYVQRSNEDGRQSPYQNQEVENKGDPLPSSSSEHLTAEPDREGASEPTSDCQMSGDSDDEWTHSGGLHSGIKKPQRAGETLDRPYTCSVCNKNFRIKSILTRHMKTHTGEKPYSCSVCGKSFIQRSYLQTHMNSHSGQKPYTCNFCGRGFTQVGNMNAHIRIHTGEKPHSCADCGKSFREKADLVKHTIIHTGEKPYTCTVCNMKFSAQSNLTRHMKTHSGERPYSCAACGKRFIRRSHLIIHMKTHAGDNS